MSQLTIPKSNAMKEEKASLCSKVEHPSSGGLLAGERVLGRGRSGNSQGCRLGTAHGQGQAREFHGS